jgi:predicted TIM-barrel fold metal-dependent hydrolase
MLPARGTLVLPLVVVAHAVIDSHLHVWDGTAAGRDPGPMKIGYSPQATASVELFMDYMDEAGVECAVFVQPWFYQVQVKLSGFHHWCRERYPYRDGLPFAEAAVRAFGADRCMWGSDFPHVLAGCGYVRNRHLLPREATFLSKSSGAS